MTHLTNIIVELWGPTGTAHQYFVYEMKYHTKGNAQALSS